MADVCAALRRQSFLFSVTSDGAKIKHAPRSSVDAFPFLIKLKNVRRVIRFSDRQVGEPPVFDREVSTAGLVCWWGKDVRGCCNGRAGCTFGDVPPNAVMTFVRNGECAPRSLGVVLQDAWLRDKCKCNRCFQDVVFRASIASTGNGIPKKLCSVTLFIDNTATNAWGIDTVPGFISDMFSFENINKTTWECSVVATSAQQMLAVVANVVSFTLKQSEPVSIIFKAADAGGAWIVERDRQTMTLSQFQCTAQALPQGVEIDIKLLLNGAPIRMLLPSGQAVDYFQKLTSGPGPFAIGPFTFNLAAQGISLSSIDHVEIQILPVRTAPIEVIAPFTFQGLCITASS